MGDREPKIWQLPFRHRDPIVGVELKVDLYELDSGGRGVQVTMAGGIATVAVRVPEKQAARLALKILATLDRDPECCRELDELRDQVGVLVEAAEYERTLRMERE
jgi:hypothetical protein